MSLNLTYKQNQLKPLKLEQNQTNREPVKVQFQINGLKTNWLNLSPEEIETIFNMFGKEED